MPERSVGNALRVGVLGAGPIAQAAHLDACAKGVGLELYALCDSAPDLLDAVSSRHRPTVTYTSYDEMLADDNVDAVVVAVADQFHVRLAIAALDAGKHVFVEKPMGVAVEECEQLVAAVAASGLTLQVGNMRRFDAGVEYARAFLAERAGGVVAMRAWYCDSAYRYAMTDALQPAIIRSDAASRPAGEPKADRVRYPLLGHASHLVDLARDLCGAIVAVRATFADRLGARCWFVAVEFADGAVGHLDLTLTVQMDWHEGFHVYGENGSVVARIFQPWYRMASEVECFAASDRSFHRPLCPDGDHYRRQLEGWAATIVDGAPQRGASVTDGLAAVRCIVAIARSASTGERVTLAEVTGGP